MSTDKEEKLYDAIMAEINTQRPEDVLDTSRQEALRTSEEDANEERTVRSSEDTAKESSEQTRNPAKRRFKTITHTELAQMEFKPLWQPVDGMITEGFTLFVGGSKVGKSWLCLDMAYCAAKGMPYLGRTTESCNVLYLALEDGKRRLKNRSVVLRILQECENLEYVTTDDDGTEDDVFPVGDDFREMLDTYLEEHGHRCLVFIDVLQRIRGPIKRSDGDAYQADYKFVRDLKRIADKHGAAIVAVHHTNKGVWKDQFHSTSGSEGLIAAADNLMMIKRERGSNIAEISLTGREVKEDMELTVQRDDSMHYHVVDTSRLIELAIDDNLVAKTVRAIARDNPATKVRLNYKDFVAFGEFELCRKPCDTATMAASISSVKDELLLKYGIKVRTDTQGRPNSWYWRKGEKVKSSNHNPNQGYVEVTDLPQLKETHQLTLSREEETE